ncbi:hypothetical protein GCM10027346_36880 [Hymenobacter seoulensis]
MFRTLLPFRRLLATSLLLVFVNVFVGQCWCATLNPVLAAPVAVAKATPAAKPSHPGCHGHAKAPTKQKPAKAQHGPDSKSKDPSKKSDCCKDNSAAILKSLTTPAEKQLLTAAPALLPASNDFFFRPVAGQWDRTHSVVLVPGEHLPPKIPDIRIFIQSLTV